MIVLPDNAKKLLSAELNGRQVFEKRNNESIRQFQDRCYAIDESGVYFVGMITDGQVICGADVNKGFDLLWDGKEWHQGKHGVFLKDYCFVTDYYGFPDGKLYRSVE